MLRKPIGLDSVDDKGCSVMNLTIGAIALIGGGHDYVHFVAAPGETDRTSFGESGSSIDIWRKSLASNCDYKLVALLRIFHRIAPGAP